MMRTADRLSVSRTGQPLVIEARRGNGSPPRYGSWQPVYDAKVERIEINRDHQPSVATIWLPLSRWNQTPDLMWGDMIRIRTDENYQSQRTVVFCGFLTQFLSDFSGGTEEPGSSFERCAIVCLDLRWCLSTTSNIFGQIVRSQDDYNNYGTPTQAPIDGRYTFASGRRTIFNANGLPNMSQDELLYQQCWTPIFDDIERATAWNAREMVRYILSPLNNLAYDYFPIANPANIAGLEHSDWNKVLSNVVVDGLNTLDALLAVCRNLGWGFRVDHGNDGTSDLVLYKIGDADKYFREGKMTILHQLHAPAVNENIAVAVSQGRKILWAMSLSEDIGPIVNNPVGLGYPNRFEFTAELVPAWADSQLVPDASESYDNLFFYEADLQEMAYPETKSYYQKYHKRGSLFHLSRDVGRKWALNEAGYYSSEEGYDRGPSFDFKNVIPAEYILDKKTGRRLFAPFARKLLSALTLDKESINSVGIKVEFSFDAGVTWQVIPAEIHPLTDEGGLYIELANLAEIAPKDATAVIDSMTVAEPPVPSPLNGKDLNYWTSICDDKLCGRIFKNKFSETEEEEVKAWKTRIRITGSVQMDQRMWGQSLPSTANGSPFFQSQIYDFSEKYGLKKRTASSSFATSGLPADEQDNSDWFSNHLGAVRRANEDLTISGQFTLERLWLGDGAGVPDFMIGDGIEKITGRKYDLSYALGGGRVYPEIVQIIYLPERQKMKLITRDLRFAEKILT